MNPIATLLRLDVEAKVLDAKKIISAQVLSSLSSLPSKEALLSALECGAYDKKFGKRRGKILTLLNEELPLEQVAAMVLNEANAELRKGFLEYVQDDLAANEYCTVIDSIPRRVSAERIEELPEAYQIDVLVQYKLTETALKKLARELNAQQGYLTAAQLTLEQRQKLTADETTNDYDDEDEGEGEGEDEGADEDEGAGKAAGSEGLK